MAGPSQEIVTSGGLPGRTVVAVGLVALFVLVGGLGVYRYARGYWLYRGFPAPTDPAFVSSKGMVERIYVSQRGARRPPPARRRLPAAGIQPLPAPALPRLLPPTRLSRPARGISADRAHGRGRGHPRRAPADPARDPRDALRIDRDVHRQGMGRTACGRTRAGRRSSRATSSAPSTPATGRSRPARPGRSVVSPRAATERSTSPFTTRASSGWWRAGPATSRPIRSARSSGRTARGSTRTARCSRSVTWQGRSAPPARASGSTRAPTTACSGRTGSSPPTWAARHPASLPRSPRRAQLGAVARQRRRRAARGCEAPGMRAVLRAASLGAALLACLAVTVAATGWLYLLRPTGPFRTTDRRRAAVRRARPPRLDLARPVRRRSGWRRVSSSA